MTDTNSSFCRQWPTSTSPILLSLTSFSPCSAFHFRWQQHPSIKWILRVTRHHYQHHHPHCFQKIIWHEIANFVEFLWKFWKYLCLRVLFKIRIMVRLSRFLSWVTIYRFSLLMFLPLSVQSSTCSTLGPASLHVPVLSFCTDLIGQLFFLHGTYQWAVIFLNIFCGWLVFVCTNLVGELCFFPQKVNFNINIKWSIKGLIQMWAYWTVIDWTFIGYFMSSYLQNCINFLKKCELGKFQEHPFSSCLQFSKLFSCAKCILNFLIVQHSIYKWLSEIEGYRWLAPFDWSSTKKNLVN